MKTKLLLLSFFILAAIIQQLSPNVTFFGNIKFPFFSSIMVYACFRLSKRNAWISSIVSAIIFDGLEPGPYGPALLTFPVITFIILRYRNNLFHEGIVTQIFCGAICYFFITLTTGFFFLVTNIREIDFFFLKLIGSLFLGSITLPVCSHLLSNVIPSEERGGKR